MRCRAEIEMLFLVALLSSCGQQPKTRRETSLPKRSAARVSAQPSGSHGERPMAQRHEAQLLLDSARLSLGRGDRAAAIALLRGAAAFFHAQAATPPTAGSDNLIDVSRRLEDLADTLRLGRDVEPERIGRLSAYANLAETERHGALASIAWSTRSRQSACDELLMAADHAERAASDGKLPATSSFRAVLDTMRVLAGTLAPSPGVDLQAIEEPLSELQAELRVLRHGLGMSDSLSMTEHGRRT